MTNNDVAIGIDNVHAPERAIAITVTPSTRQTHIVMLKNRHPIPEGAVTLTPEELHQHILGCVKAFEAVQGSVGQTKLVLPHMIGGKPFMP